jgi:hypothetical protein
MKTEEIIKGNKLIVEFMGWKETSKNLKWVSHYGDDYDNRTMFSGWIKQEQEYLETEPLIVVENNKRKIDFLRNLLYDTSWDWLMPVVEKIENLDFVNYSLISKRNYINGDIYYKIQLGRDTEENIDPVNFPIEIMESKSKIYATWIAVIEFIKWYNENRRISQE